MYTPMHPNESLMIVSIETGIAVREYRGGGNRMKILTQLINRDLYRVEYAGEYLGKVNKKLLDSLHT